MASQNKQFDETDDKVNKLVKPFRQKVRKAFSEAQTEQDWNAVQAALEAQNALAAQNAIDLGKLEAELKSTQQNYLDGLREGGTLAVNHVPAEARVGLPVFDLLDPIVINYAATQVGNLVTEVTLSTQAAIRWQVSQAVINNWHPKEAARRLRNVIGLTERQAQAVERRRQSMLAEGVAEPTANKFAAKHSARLLDYRTNLIANTEMANAVNQGKQYAWEQLDANDQLDTVGVQRVWVTSRDEVVCAICGPMDKQARGINQPFMTGNGKSVMMPGGSVHPGCRCVVILKMKG